MKTAKPPLPSFLLLFCHFTDELWKQHQQNAETKTNSTKNPGDDDLWSTALARRNTMSLSWYRQRAEAFVFTRLQCLYRPFEEISTWLRWHIVMGLDCEERCFGAAVACPPGSKRGMVAFNAKIGMFGWKKQPQKRYQVPKNFLQYADQNGGSNLLHFCISDTYNLSSRYHQKPWKRHSCSRTWPPHVLEDRCQIKREEEASAKLAAERPILSCSFRDQPGRLADFSKLSRSWSRQKLDQLQKKIRLVKNYP